MAEDTKVREIIISESIAEGMVANIVKEIRDINKYDDKQEKEKKEYERKPITIIVNTFGGSVYDGFAIVAAIEMSKTPIHTVCLGKAMSMGFMILAAGHKRFMHPLATAMYHQISTGAWGKLEEIQESVDQAKVLEQMYDNYILKTTNILKEKLDAVKLSKTDWYIQADDAKKLGIIDEIIGKEAA